MVRQVAIAPCVTRDSQLVAVEVVAPHAGDRGFEPMSWLCPESCLPNGVVCQSERVELGTALPLQSWCANWAVGTPLAQAYDVGTIFLLVLAGQVAKVDPVDIAHLGRHFSNGAVVSFRCRTATRRLRGATRPSRIRGRCYHSSPALPAKRIAAIIEKSHQDAGELKTHGPHARKLLQRPERANPQGHGPSGQTEST